MGDYIDYLSEEKVDKALIAELKAFRKENEKNLTDSERIVRPEFKYYGRETLEKAIAALLAGENILLVGPKATGKNVLATNLAYLFQRPLRDISFHVNSDYSSLIGADSFKEGEVYFRKGPIYKCAELGGFGVLDEINMAKNEAISVLHASLDHRRLIDIPGYERIKLNPATRFIGTMNYGYVGTRELNEALASRFMIIRMPNITDQNLDKLLRENFPTLKEKYRRAFIDLFVALQEKSVNSEISTKSVDLRGLIGSIRLMRVGLSPYKAIEIGLVNKSFDDFERDLVRDLVDAKIPKNIEEGVFDD